MLSSLKYWVWLHAILEPSAAWQVYRAFSSPDNAFFADERDFDRLPHLTGAQKNALKRKHLGRTEEILDDCLRHNIHIVTWQDADYPERLRNTVSPPLLYYQRGKPCQWDEETAIAMVGTRKASLYGERMARDIAAELTLEGGLVVTGLVKGCDYNAAVGALRAGGPVVCVTAGGVDVPYYESRSGRDFLEDIAAAGTLVSLQPPGTPHMGQLFSRRNLFLTGLTVGTLCVEAGARSGALQVARMALDQSRDVYAVPANVGVPSAAGSNALLRDGLAIAVLRGRDVLSHYRHRFPLRTRSAPALPRYAPPAPRRAKKSIDNSPAPVYCEEKNLDDRFTDDEQTVLRVLRQGPLAADELIERAQLPAPRALAAANLLVLRGFVAQLPGGRFQLSAQMRRQTD